jgi:hypothetical protein
MKKKNLKMKHIPFLITLLILASCGGGTEIPCIPSNLSDHVIAFYPFSNQSLADISGNSLNLINNDNCLSVKDRNGNERCAYRFNGTKTQYLTRDGSFLNDFKSRSFSISLWYYPIDGENDRQILFTNGARGMTSCGSFNIEEWFIILHDCERISFYINKKAQWDDFPDLWQNPQVIDKCREEIKLYENKWHHLVATYDKGKLTLYRNGIKAKANTQEWNCSPVLENNGDIFIGNDFFGNIDDIIIFDKALNQSDVNDLFNLDACCM